MGAKGSVEAAKYNAQQWNSMEGSRHRHSQRSHSLNRGHSLSRAPDMW